MNTIHFQKAFPKQINSLAVKPILEQNCKLQRPYSAIQDDALEDDFINGDFTNNLIISTLNNWSKQHLNSIKISPKRLFSPPVN